jgi:hypothetical protein
MARRPIFIPLSKPSGFVGEVSFDFQWSPGFSASQKKKNVVALHQAAQSSGLYPVLEVSTKSEDILGQRLSAFSLKIKTDAGELTIESAFQGSKVFLNGGPYTDLYHMDSRSAKTDARLKTSGPLIGFSFFGQTWPLEPKTAFYDWLYLSALHPHMEFLRRLFKYEGFSDIEFNPDRSINCQARTCALLVSLLKLNLLDRALTSQSDFISIVAPDSYRQPHSKGGFQTLFVDEE